MKNSKSLKLESLKNEYGLAIIEYNSAYTNFMDLINQSGTSMKKLDNSTIIGKPYLSSLLVDDVSICLQDCESDKNCSGLDYSEKNNKCTFFKGNISVKNNNNNNTVSYIKDIKSFYLELIQINNKLNNIVSEINTILEEYDPKSKEESDYKQEEINDLTVKYNLLQSQNDGISQLINQKDDLTNEYNITNLMINRSTLTYFLWVLLLLIILIFIIKYVFYS
jgi:hypothetical protein